MQTPILEGRLESRRCPVSSILCALNLPLHFVQSSYRLNGRNNEIKQVTDLTDEHMNEGGDEDESHGYI